MPLSRRTFLRHAVAHSVTTLPLSALAGPTLILSQQSSLLNTLCHLLDLLLPEDEWSGSATQLGVDQTLLTVISQQPQLEQISVNALRWINNQANGDFRQLTDEQASELIEMISNAPSGSLMRVFFDAIRYHAIRLYYSDPRSWQGLAIEHPPQPIGYTLQP